LADKKGTPEYDEWFLKYNPGLARKEPESRKSLRRKEPESVFIETPNAKEKASLKPKKASPKKASPKKEKMTRHKKKPSSKAKTPKNKLLKNKSNFVF